MIYNPDFELVFERTEKCMAIADDVRLRPGEWGLIYAADGHRCLLELAQDLRLSPDITRTSVFRLVDLGYLRQCDITLEEYTRIGAAVRSIDPPQTLAEFLDHHGARPSGLTPTPQKETIGVTASLRKTPLQEPLPAQPITPSRPAGLPFQPLEAHASQERKLNLGALIRFITNRFQDATAGQLAVYRVFMGIGTTLLRREGIHTLRFDEDKFIRDSELIDALEAAVRKTLGLEIPREVFSFVSSNR